VSFRTSVFAAYSVVSSDTYYHGAASELPTGRLKPFSKRWKAFDGKEVDMPFWVSPSKKFAELHGNHVYEVKVHVPKEKIFGAREYTGPGRYWEDMVVDDGKLLYSALEKGELFGDVENFESVFQDLIREDYDIVETEEFISWLKKKGFRATHVSGDGERNLMVFDPTDIEVMRSVDK